MKRTIVALGLVLLVAALAAAQTDGMVLVRTHGTWSDSDASYAGRAVDWFTVEAPGDGRVDAVVVSVDVQPLLLIDRDGSVDETSGSRNAARTSRRLAAGDLIRIGVAGDRTASVWTGLPSYTLQISFGGGDAALAVGSIIAGSLEAGDEEADDGSYIDWYPLQVTPGGRIRVDVSSYDFDTYLIVELPSGGVLENDDAVGTDSSVGFSPSVDGIARIGVKSYGYGESGQYELRVSTETEEVIRIGDVIDGELTSGSDVYVMNGSPEAMVEVTLSSFDFDSILTIDDPDGTYLTNDDYGDSLDSRLLYSFGPSGQATITVSSYGGTGFYTLSVQESKTTVETIRDGYPLMDGDVITGQLGPRSPSLDGSYYQRFTFEAERGERVEITLESDSFDSFLRVVDPSGFEETDDDSGGNLNSRIVFTAEEDGVHEVYATTLGGGESGVYTLSFEKRGMSRVIFSSRGQLTPNDQTDITGKVYDVYEFRAQAGSTIIIDVESNAFDALAILRDSTGQVLLQDDDSGSDSNARIEFVPDRSGRFEIVVTSYMTGAYGNYTVTVYE